MLCILIRERGIKTQNSDLITSTNTSLDVQFNTMSSSVHFKFKSQREPSRVTFDGTGISVFELKREIINQSRLGDGSDFELSIYNEGTGEGKLLGALYIQ